MKKLFLIPLSLFLIFIVWCSDANTVSKNISKDADYFKINRRVVFYNGITNDYILSIEGLCSLWNNDDALRMTVTCKTGKDEYKKHFLWLSDNVTFFAEQLEPSKVSAYYYKVIFKPQSIIPDIDIKIE